MPEVAAYAVDSPTGRYEKTTITRREPGPTEVYFDIHYAGICHSDIHTIRGDWGPVAFPQVVGHEIVGHVSALGAGVRSEGRNAACSAIGSTGVHLQAKSVADVVLNAERTGYVIALPIPGIVTQVQTNMGATINLDWLLQLGADLLGEFGVTVSLDEMIGRVDRWFAESRPGNVLYHPYISEAGERGPFVNARARAGFTGLAGRHRYPDLVRAVVEGLGINPVPHLPALDPVRAMEIVRKQIP